MGPAGPAGAPGPQVLVYVGDSTVGFPNFVTVVGGKLDVWGVGFDAGESVLIQIGDESLGSVEANDDGAFQTTTDALPDTITPGVYKLVAQGDAGNTAIAPVQVVAKEK